MKRYFLFSFLLVSLLLSAYAGGSAEATDSSILASMGKIDKSSSDKPVPTKESRASHRPSVFSAVFGLSDSEIVAIIEESISRSDMRPWEESTLRIALSDDDGKAFVDRVKSETSGDEENVRRMFLSQDGIRKMGDAAEYVFMGKGTLVDFYF